MSLSGPPGWIAKAARAAAAGLADVGAIDERLEALAARGESQFWSEREAVNRQRHRSRRREHGRSALSIARGVGHDGLLAWGMGYYTSLQTSSGETPPNAWFSKYFSNVIAAIPGKSGYVNVPELPDAVWRAIEPLTRIFQPEDHENAESFWQAPATLLASVDAVLAILRSDSTPIEARRIVHEYYTKADFEGDLVKLKSELEWVTQRGILRVRLWMT